MLDGHRPAANHAAAVRPHTTPAGWVTVEGVIVCAVCGRPVTADAQWRWRHTDDLAVARASYLIRPVELADLPDLGSYRTVAERYPWVTRSDLGRSVTTSPDQWDEARQRLTAYAVALDLWRQAPRVVGNPLLELMQLVLRGTGADTSRSILAPGLSQVLDLPARRRELAALFSWAVPHEGALDVLAGVAPLDEVGAGTGYWAAVANAAGIDVAASDRWVPGASTENLYHRGTDRTWSRVASSNAVDVVASHRNRTLFMCWPAPEDEASHRPLRTYQGDHLLMVGTYAAGSGSIRFHRELEANWTVTGETPLPSWPGIPDSLRLLRRNTHRRPAMERDRCHECRSFVPTGHIGRCRRCRLQRPQAVALRSGPHVIEYPATALAAMPPAVRWALEHSPNRIDIGHGGED